MAGWQSLAECGGLENRWRVKPSGGSNPSPAAIGRSCIMQFNILGLELTRACTNRCKYCYGKEKPIRGNAPDTVIRSAL